MSDKHTHSRGTYRGSADAPAVFDRVEDEFGRRGTVTHLCGGAYQRLMGTNLRVRWDGERVERDAASQTLRFVGQVA